MLHILRLYLILAVLTPMITCEPIPIINGVTAVPLVNRNGETRMQNTGRYPYIVSVEKSDKICAGVLIKDNIVLTAAHCTFEQTKIMVVAGTLDLHNDPLDRRQTRIVESIIRHPKYQEIYKTGNPYDIAVLQVARKFTLNILVNTIKLAKEDHIGKKAFVLGWGSTNTEIYSPLLLKANLEILSSETCKMELQTVAKNKFMNAMMCARDSGKTQTICNGDSGGPLVVHSKQGGFDVLVGLSSWGIAEKFKNKKQKCNPNYPSVFVRISKIRPWLKATVNI